MSEKNGSKLIISMVLMAIFNIIATAAIFGAVPWAITMNTNMIEIKTDIRYMREDIAEHKDLTKRIRILEIWRAEHGRDSK